jgi:hypothetical protein
VVGLYQPIGIPTEVCAVDIERLNDRVVGESYFGEMIPVYNDSIAVSG